MDEVFSRENYLTTIYIQVRYPDKTLKQDMNFHKQIEQIHIYRKTYEAKPNLPTKDSNVDKFCFYINEKSSGKKIILGSKEVTIFNEGDYEIIKSDGSENGLKEIWASGTILDGNSSGRFFRDYLTGRYTEDGLGVLYKVSGIGDDKFDYRYFTGPKREGATKGKYYQGVPKSQLENPNAKKTSPIENYLDLAGSFGNCRSEGGVEFRSGKKPEILIQKIINNFSNPGDIILDSFAGSGTTGAVAHKMRRRWIMVELGEHCHTHVIPRLQKVINGEDQSGISKEVNWQGGGGFLYYRLAPSLLEKDKWDNWIINHTYNAPMLSEALCKLEGFTYAPSDSIYWQQGYSTENDFIYVTTAHLTNEQLQQLSDEVGNDRTLLVLCTSFRANIDHYQNLTVKKIPQHVLLRCEWGHDDYSLRIENLPSSQPEQEQKNQSNEEISYNEPTS